MTDATAQATFALQPISDDAASTLRDSGGELYVADTVPGFPCRQCLQDAAIGDELILVSYDPFQTDSPYRSASPIFLHRHPCTPTSGAPTPSAHVPEQLTRRQLSVRAFDRDEMMIDAAVIDGHALAATAEHLLAQAATQKIHVHNASRGCWAVAIERDADSNKVSASTPKL